MMASTGNANRNESDHESVASSEDGNAELFPLSDRALEDSIDSDSDDDTPIADLLDDTPIAQLPAAIAARSKRAMPQPTQQLTPVKRKAQRPPFHTTLPSFDPLFLDPNRCQSKGRPNMISIRNSHIRNPLGLFKLFIPTAILNEIATNTNKYAASKGAGAGRCRRWTETNALELQCFFGLCIYMGIYRSPRIEDYWERSGYGPCHSICAAMPLKRFQQLKRFLHICDHEGDNGSSFFFNKVEPLFGAVIGASKRLWIPSYKLSVDEMMVMNYERSAETVRMHNNPIGFGFKIWAICDSGYTYYAFPHSNKEPWRHCKDYKGLLSHSSAVVAQLCGELPRRRPGSQDLLMYAIYMDNLFSTPRLFKLLRDKEIGAAGTVRSNAGGFPKPLAIRGDKGVKLDWNTIGAEICEGGSVLALTWIDNGAVQMLTTIHNVGEDHTVERRRKRPRLTSTNGARVRDVFGPCSTKVLNIPQVVDDYNYNMGGVDIADQLRSVYTWYMDTRRTWMPLPFWLLDCAAKNSYILLSKMYRATWSNNHKKFMAELAWALVREYCASRTVPVRSRGELDTALTLRSNKCAKAGGFVTQTVRSRESAMIRNEQHMPLRVANRSRASCYNCRLKQRAKAAKTSFKCSSCGIFLCLEAERNCFYELHSQVIGERYL